MPKRIAEAAAVPLAVACMAGVFAVFAVRVAASLAADAAKKAVGLK